MASKFQKEAKIAKNDEFYTQYHDIEKEMNAYLDYNPDVFREKTILLPCDDPYESNFFKYFALRFKDLGLKKIIATCFDGSLVSNRELSLFDDETVENKTTRKAHKLILTDPPDFDKVKIVNLPNIKEILSDKQRVIRLDGNGDFRSNEVKALRDEVDYIITNPPFSLFREFLAWIVEADKKFIIIGNINAITYKEVFPLVKDNKIWLGSSITSGDREFIMPASIVDKDKFTGEVRKNAQGENIYYQKVVGVRWFTNLDHGRRHEPLPLMTMADNIKFSKHKEIKGKEYQKYHNYNAIEVPYVDAIPSDYGGAMGVPISLLDKYNPVQFEILGSNLTLGTPMSEVAKKGTFDQGGPSFYTANNDKTFKRIYTRIIIKHKGH